VGSRTGDQCVRVNDLLRLLLVVLGDLGGCFASCTVSEPPLRLCCKRVIHVLHVPPAGLATYGAKIMRVLGVKMTRLTNTRGKCGADAV
jgi:hypothetical protein